MESLQWGRLRALAPLLLPAFTLTSQKSKESKQQPASEISRESSAGKALFLSWGGH